MENVINRETAEQEFERWCDAMKFDIDYDSDDENTRRGRVQAKRKIVRAIERGELVVDEKGYAKLLNADVKGEPTDVCFNRLYAGLYTAMDRKKEGQGIGKSYAALAALTGLPDTTFDRMHPYHVGICTAVILYFLAQ